MPRVSRSVIRASSRLVAGCLGMGIGWIIWSTLWAQFTTEISSSSNEAVRDSGTFGFMCGLLAAFLVVGCGQLLSTLADQAAIRLSRTTNKNSGVCAS